MTQNGGSAKKPRGKFFGQRNRLCRDTTATADNHYAGVRRQADADFQPNRQPCLSKTYRNSSLRNWYNIQASFSTLRPIWTGRPALLTTPCGTTGPDLDSLQASRRRRPYLYSSTKLWHCSPWLLAQAQWPHNRSRRIRTLPYRPGRTGNSGNRASTGTMQPQPLRNVQL